MGVQKLPSLKRVMYRMKNNIIGVCPGSFDPITNGHLDIIERAAKLFENVIVLLLTNPNKGYSFTTNEKLKMIKNTTEHLGNVKVDCFSGLLANYKKGEYEKICLVKGLRAVSDFEYEIQHAVTNKILNNDVETIFINSEREYIYISSSMVKQVARFNGDISAFVHRDNLSIIVDKIYNEE